MLAEFSKKFLDLINILKAGPEENLLSTCERAFRFVEEPSQILIVSFNLTLCISACSIVTQSISPYRPHDLWKVFQNLGKHVIRYIRKPTRSGRRESG